MRRGLDPFRFLAGVLAGWANQQQQDAIEYLREENHVLREQLAGKRIRSSQTTGSTPYSFQYTYNAAGLLTSETYPSQRTVSYAYNPLGRTTTATGLLGTTTTPYAGDSIHPIIYAPHGAISSLKLGNGIVETTTYNARLQPTEIDAGSLFTLANCYDNSQSNCSGVSGLPATNNGNIWGQKVNSVSRTYTYDGFNRLTFASQGGGQTYTYDTRGNRAVTGAGTNSLEVPTNFSAYSSDNRNSNWDYDGSGNVIRIPSTSLGPVIRSATYDAENRMITETTANGGTATYFYDGDGHRVKKSVIPAGGTQADTFYAYDAMGNLVAEYGAAGQSTGTRFLSADHLGSTRLITTASGTVDQSIDYFPFGEEIASSYPGYPQAAGSPSIKFTSKERDAETGLDFYSARYMSSAQGRFASPDEFTGGIVDPLTGEQVGVPGPLLYADITDPQTLNKYGYVRNNPLRYTDPDGHCIFGLDTFVCAAAGYGALAYGVTSIVNSFFEAKNAEDEGMIFAGYYRMLQDRANDLCVRGSLECGKALEAANRAKLAAAKKVMKTAQAAAFLPETLGGGPAPASRGDVVSGIPTDILVNGILRTAQPDQQNDAGRQQPKTPQETPRKRRERPPEKPCLKTRDDRCVE